MPDRCVLNTWKEVAAYLKRGVRTVQRWEVAYKMPVHRPSGDARTVFAFADEIDAWMARVVDKGVPYVRPTVIVLDAITAASLSNLKLALEAAKFNVLTAFTSAELLATAARYDVDGFVIDSIVLDSHPAELGAALRSRYPQKPRLLVGDDPVDNFDQTISADDPTAVVRWLIEKLGEPRLTSSTDATADGEGLQSAA